MYTSFNPLCAEYVCIVVIQEYVAIHEMWKESTCSICVGGPGRLPAPSPHSVGGAVGGGGEGGWRAMSCLGILSGEGGISGKQAASWNGKFFWQIIRRIILADESGSFSRQDILAGHFGTFIWRIFTSNEKVSCWAKKKKKKKCTISESVDCIMSLYVASNIMLFCSRCRFNWTSKLWSCNRGYCGSVDLTANENIHHEEEAWPNFCCSLLL
jgi:hypothetical protein